MNTVYLGNGTYGIQAAAELYYGKDAADLGWAEASFLAGLIRNPVGFDPLVAAELARERRDLVVERLLDLDHITPSMAVRIMATAIPESKIDLLPKPKDHFVGEVIRRMLADPRLGGSQSERYNALFRGGLTIRTTLDPRAQALAQEAVASQLPDTEGRFTASLVSVDPATGAVRALVGGEGFEKSKYNIATQGPGRQGGSAFKPFVLAAAIEDGISPRSTINGVGPCSVPNPGGTPDPYEVENFGGSRGSVGSLYSATQNSLNCAFIRLGLVVGLERVAEVATAMGITTELRPVISMSLGANEVRPLDMASAFATLAAGGLYRDPYLVEEILDRDGNRVFAESHEGQQVIAAETAHLVTDVLRGVVSGGTGTRARFRDGRPAAGKTGTTQNFADAWFVGYTPQLSTAVWMGSPTARVPMTRVAGVGRVTGGSFPAQIWQAFMGPMHEGLEVVPFERVSDNGSVRSLRLAGERAPREEAADDSTTTAVPEETTTSVPSSETTTTSAPPPPPTTTSTTSPPPTTSTTSPPPSTTTTQPPPDPEPPPEEQQTAADEADGDG